MSVARLLQKWGSDSSPSRGPSEGGVARGPLFTPLQRALCYELTTWSMALFVIIHTELA
jgi:hypothetical protein